MPGVSITVTTDVFCDGPDCADWVHGTTGTRPNAAEARSNARRYGWKRIDGKDYCPDCAKGVAS